ncbi:MAG: hypothetical protein VXW65_05925 [Pseudomonadota bacterium]|nr:hypothetical protein [Pseudomonadota bacterium]
MSGQTYRADEKVAPLVRQLSWARHVMNLGQCKRAEKVSPLATQLQGVQGLRLDVQEQQG